jgi:hypothetical protein
MHGNCKRGPRRKGFEPQHEMPVNAACKNENTTSWRFDLVGGGYIFASAESAAGVQCSKGLLFVTGRFYRPRVSVIQVCGQSAALHTTRGMWTFSGYACGSHGPESRRSTMAAWANRRKSSSTATAYGRRQGTNCTTPFQTLNCSVPSCFYTSIPASQSHHAYTSGKMICRS